MHFDPSIMFRSCAAFGLILSTPKPQPLICSETKPESSAYLETIPDDPQEIIALVNDLASTKISQLQQLFILGKAYQTLERKCQEMRRNATVGAFFLSHLNTRDLTDQKTQLQEMEETCLYIQEFVKATHSMAPDQSTEDVPRKLDAPDMQEDNAIDVDHTSATQKPQEIQSAPPQAPPPPEAPQPPQAPDAPAMKIETASGSSQEDASAAKAKHDAREKDRLAKHDAREKDRLDRELQERADSGVFYIKTPPKNENDLKEQKKAILKDIEKIEKINDKAWLQEKQEALARIDKQLVPQETLLQYANSLHKVHFNSTIAKFTNDELCLVIGFIFNGKIPDENNEYYRYYKLFKELLDKNIFDRWEQLVTKGKAFLKYEDGWKRNLKTNIFGFIATLDRRFKTNKDKLPEPIYQPKPYGEKKKTRTLTAGVDSEKKKVDMNELKKKLDKRGKIDGSPAKSSQ